MMTLLPKGLSRLFQYWRFRLSERRERRSTSEDSKLDSRSNEESKLPEDERLDLAAVWVAEIYPPSAFATLVQRLDTLGWLHSPTHRAEDLQKWVQQARHERFGWTTLGLVARTDSSYLGVDHVSELPAGIEVAMPYLHSLSSGITVLSTLFVVDDSVGAEITRLMKADFQTERRPVQRWPKGTSLRRRATILWKEAQGRSWPGHSMTFPDARRRGEVLRTLRAQREECQDWIRQRFPGALTSLGKETELPSCQLLLTEKSEPLPVGAPEKWTWSIGLIGRFASWAYDAWPSMLLTFPNSTFREDEVSRCLTFLGRRGDVPRLDSQSEPSNFRVTHAIDDSVRALLVRWSLSVLVEQHRSHLASVRDSIARSADRSAAPMKALASLRRLVAREWFDADVVAYEGTLFSKDQRWYEHGVPDFQEAEVLRAGEQPRQLLEVLRLGLAERSEKLASELRLVATTLSTITNVTTAMWGIRLQRIVIFFTVVSVVVASWAAWAALHVRPGH